MRTEVITVTPALASEWLATNPHNRVISQVRINRYGRDMAERRWHLNAQPVIFDGEGKLRQGHHRCHACVQFSTTFETLAVWFEESDNSSEATYLTMDSGKPWSSRDHLAYRGEVDYSSLDGATRWVWRYFNKDLNAQKETPSPETIIGFLEQNPGIRNYLQEGRRIRQKTGIPQPLASGSYYIAAGLNEADADDFYGRLESGENLEAGNPILVLRSLFETERSHTNVRMQPRKSSALVIKAWNAYRDGDQIQRLAWRQGGKSPEPFPEMH